MLFIAYSPCVAQYLIESVCCRKCMSMKLYIVAAGIIYFTCIGFQIYILE